MRADRRLHGGRDDQSAEGQLPWSASSAFLGLKKSIKPCSAWSRARRDHKSVEARRVVHVIEEGARKEQAFLSTHSGVANRGLDKERAAIVAGLIQCLMETPAGGISKNAEVGLPGQRDGLFPRDVGDVEGE